MKLNSTHNLLNKMSALSVFILFAQLSFGQTYPDMANVIKPNPEPNYPSGFDAFSPPVNTSKPAADVPIFAEWTRQAKPDDNIIATGFNFTTNTDTASGKDTRFLIYGSSETSGDVLKDGKILRLDGRDKLTLTMDTDLPDSSMYLVWPKNSVGWGRPITVNQTSATWAGQIRPLQVKLYRYLAKTSRTIRIL